MKRNVFTVVLCTAVLFIASAHVHAQDTTSTRSKWLDDYPKKVGFTWGVNLEAHANYIWRGLRIGGLCHQGSATVGYGGAYVDGWWSLGATDWQLNTFLPEVDVVVGFRRWGLDVNFIYICNFNGPKNDAGEIRLKYKVSNKLPLSLQITTRPGFKDHYYTEAGEKVRAYSTYFELGYDFALPYDLAISPRVGFTPWKSLYTGYLGNFAVNNISMTLTKVWNVKSFMDVNVFAAIMTNPWRISYEQRQGQGLSANGLMFDAGVRISFK